MAAIKKTWKPSQVPGAESWFIKQKKQTPVGTGVCHDKTNY